MTECFNFTKNFINDVAVEKTRNNRSSSTAKYHEKGL